MRAAVLFFVGLLVGAAVQVPLAQNQSQNQVVSMNHVGIRVPNIEEAIKYYTEKMGYKVAFRGLNPQGGTQLVYLYVSQNTFLELGQAGDGQPAGFTHYGLHVQNAQKAVDMFRQRGIKAEDVRKSGPTGAMLSNLTDPYMGRIELVEYTPESLHGKAVASWKP
jgi:catechol 2,3-dioxygenase-like lactoylglutathione lyase family enzyme